MTKRSASKSDADLVLFLACSFAKAKVDGEGTETHNGVSDWDLAQRVIALLSELSGGRIRATMTVDPFDDYISSTIRRNIASSDLMLCLFTKRSQDVKTKNWTPSSYTISEASAFLAQLPTEYDAHNRLFGLIEEGIDRSQLGLAFHRDKALTSFRRQDDETLRHGIQKIVDSVFEKSIKPRGIRECLSLQKTAYIMRSGWVRVEIRYRFQLTESVQKISIPHSIWRISSEVPELSTLLDIGESNQFGMLRVVPLNCGIRDRPACRFQIRPIETPGNGNERRFFVDVSEINLSSSEELEYAITWEYPGAFCSVPSEQQYPNTVGLGCGRHGPVGKVTFAVMLERDLDSGEPHRLLEESPTLHTTPLIQLPSDEDHEEFWHSSDAWSLEKTLNPCPKQSGAQYEVYRWKADDFNGMAKFVFQPYVNYFHTETNVAARTDRPSSQLAEKPGIFRRLFNPHPQPGPEK